MKQKIKHVVSLLTAVLFTISFTVSCRPDPEVYARPSDLVGPIRTQLEARGNFTYFLECLDRTVYAEPLDKGGSWTLFAPNDEAFEAFMEEEGYSSVDEISSARVLDLVQYSIIIDAWNKITLSYSTGNGYYEGSALKRETQYQDSIIKVEGTEISHIEGVNPATSYNIDLAVKTRISGSKKSTTYFIPSYIDHPERAIENEDVEFMTDSEYNQGDMQVFDANVINDPLIAENGLIYELDKVIEPKPNMYQNLTAFEYDGKYTLFKSLLERFAYLSSTQYTTFDNGEQIPVNKIMFYTNYGDGEGNLPYNPNDEDFPPLICACRHTDNYSTAMLVPSNQALEDYLNGDSVLAQHYDSYDDMSLDVLSLFLEVNFLKFLWALGPSREGQALTTTNAVSDYRTEDAVDKKLCSNGFFVGVDKIYENTSFSSILGPILINPDYTIMKKGIQDLGYEDGFKSKASRFSIFAITNEKFKELVINDPNNVERQVQIVDYNEDLSVIQIQVTGDPVASNNRLYPESLTDPDGIDLLYVNKTIQAIVDNLIVDSDVDFNADNYYATRSGEYLYADNSSISGVGNIQANETVNVLETSVSTNGTIYEMDGYLERPANNAYKTLNDRPDMFSLFVNVLDAAELTVAIEGSDDKFISLFSSSKRYTILAPNNQAVQQAINDGLIIDPNNMPSKEDDELAYVIARENLENFVRKHILQTSIPTNGISLENVQSMYSEKEIDFEPLYIRLNVNNFNTALEKTLNIVSTTNEFLGTTTSNVNIFSKRVVIHEIDSYLNY